MYILTYVLVLYIILCSCHWGSKAYELLSDIILNKYLLDDIKKLSLSKHTSSLESYHSVVNHFVSKLLAFSNVGMQCR